MQTLFSQCEFLARFIVPRPFARFMAIDEYGIGAARFLHLPWDEPALSMERAGVTSHIRPERNSAVPECERPAANSTGKGHEWETGALQGLAWQTFRAPQSRLLPTAWNYVASRQVAPSRWITPGPPQQRKQNQGGHN